MPLKRLLPTVAIIGFLLGGLAFALVAGPMHIGNLAPAASAAPNASASPSAKAAKAQAACDAFVKDFASKLGVTEDKLKTSLKAALTDAIDRAVANGDMTADQATKAKARLDAVKGCESLPAFRRGFAGPGKPGGMAGLAGISNAAASALGVTPADLKTAIESGKTLHDVAGTKISKAEFDTKFRAALAKEIQPQVDSGKITAAQAKARVDAAATMAAKLWDSSLKDAAGGFFGRNRGAPKAPPGAPSSIQ